MLLGLWIARNVNQVRGVMVAGSTLLLILAAYLTVSYIGLRNGGATDEMLYTDSIVWYAPLHIAYSVGVDGISVVMLLLSSIIVFTGTFASWKLKPLTKEADPDADGRICFPAYRYFRNLLWCRR